MSCAGPGKLPTGGFQSTSEDFVKFSSIFRIGFASVFVTTVALAGCDTTPVTPAPGMIIGAMEHIQVEFVDVRISGFETSVQVGDATVPGTVSARLTTRPNNPGGWIKIDYPSAQADGEGSALDIGIGELISCDISGTVDLAADALNECAEHGFPLEFEGIATLRSEGDRGKERFPVKGTVRQDAEAPDCIIFDIVGSGVHSGVRIQFEAEARIRLR